MRSALPVLADTFVAPPFIESSPVAALSEAAAAKDCYGWKNEPAAREGLVAAAA